jgi:hypothetical protein
MCELFQIFFMNFVTSYARYVHDKSMCTEYALFCAGLPEYSDFRFCSLNLPFRNWETTIVVPNLLNYIDKTH